MLPPVSSDGTTAAVLSLSMMVMRRANILGQLMYWLGAVRIMRLMRGLESPSTSGLSFDANMALFSIAERVRAFS